MNVNLYILASVTGVSLISFVGLLYLTLNKKNIERILNYIVSFGAGVFFGEVFIHLMPRIATTHSYKGILTGIVLFFVLEKAIYLHRCYNLKKCEHAKMHGVMGLVGDAVHNFLDGIMIAGSFLVSIPLGITTTIAIALHEIPKEISDFGIYLHAGFSQNRALLFNFISSLAALVGALFVIVLHKHVENIQNMLMPVTAGAFIYIAGSNLIPVLHEEKKFWNNILQIILLVAGMGLMTVLD